MGGVGEWWKGLDTSGMGWGLVEGGGRVRDCWEGLGRSGCVGSCCEVLTVLEASGMGLVLVGGAGGWWRLLGGDGGCWEGLMVGRKG